jgi:hypothetical protein
MPTDPVTLLLWLMLAALARSPRWPSGCAIATDPAILRKSSWCGASARQPERGLGRHWGRDYKVAVGSAGIKSVVREARMEEAYQCPGK